MTTGRSRPRRLSALTLGAATAGPLIGPVSLHRLVAGRHIKLQAAALASLMTKTGIVMLAATVALTLLLVLRTAMNDTLALWLTAGITVWVAALWFLLPVWARRHYTRPAIGGVSRRYVSGPGGGWSAISSARQGRGGR
ncbi:DUF6328 family protein [Streptomyces xanthophaeus]